MECPVDHARIKLKFCPQCGLDLSRSPQPNNYYGGNPAQFETKVERFESFTPMHPVYAAQTTNGFAIAGFVTSLIACWPIGLILSAVALSQFKKNPNQKGKGLAIAGLVIGLVTTLFVLIAFIAALASSNN